MGRPIAVEWVALEAVGSRPIGDLVERALAGIEGRS